jgi:hypothetical protein
MLTSYSSCFIDILVIVRHTPPNDLRSIDVIHRESFDVPPSLAEALGADIRVGFGHVQYFCRLFQKGASSVGYQILKSKGQNSHPNLATGELPFKNY